MKTAIRGLLKSLRKLDYAQSRMSLFDEYALRTLLAEKQGLSILEIGSWLGAGSTKIFSEFASKLVCVDHWQGNENQAHKKIISEFDPYSVFQKNIAAFKDIVVSIKAPSSAIKNLLHDKYFDFIFIDGDHRYQQTLEDISNCISLVKPGGIIAGHDCEARLSELPRSFTNEELVCDHMPSLITKFKECHPGVITAVDKVFGRDVELFADDKRVITLQDSRIGYSTIWFKSC